MITTDLYKNPYDAVKEFMIAADQLKTDQKQLDKDNITEEDLTLIKLRLQLIFEEFQELVEAIVNPTVKKLMSVQFHVLNQMIKLLEVTDLSYNKVEVLDGLVDLEYVLVGSAIAFNLPFKDGFKLIHDNNMTKVDPVTGKCIKDERGKILKPADFQPVDLSTLFK